MLGVCRCRLALASHRDFFFLRKFCTARSRHEHLFVLLRWRWTVSLQLTFGISADVLSFAVSADVLRSF